MKDRFKIFSQNIKIERQAQGLTQRQMAEKLEISQPVYNRYEKGGTNQGREPDFDTLCKISQIFGVTTDYLLGLED